LIQSIVGLKIVVFIKYYNRNSSQGQQKHYKYPMLFKFDNPYDSSVHYTLNKDGYRCPEWEDIDWSNSHLLFGCSVVQGIGLEDSETLDNQLTKILNEPVINLGQCGGSSSFILAITYKLIDAGIRPKSVILVYPESSRVALFLNNKILHVGIWTQSNELDHWYKEWLKDGNAEYHGYLAGRSIEAAWNNVGIEVTSVHQPTLPGLRDLPRYVDFAKDNGHPGPMTIKQWARYIAKKKTQS
jgi:hypothetical protein